ncbi:hypothetical protein NL108_013328, partial [Boleophthalmus pectinirostris]
MRRIRLHLQTAQRQPGFVGSR